MGYVKFGKPLRKHYIIEIPNSEAKQIKYMDEELLNKLSKHIRLPESMTSEKHIFVFSTYPKEILDALEYWGIEYELWESEPKMVKYQNPFYTQSRGKYGKPYYQRVKYEKTKRLK